MLAQGQVTLGVQLHAFAASTGLTQPAPNVLQGLNPYSVRDRQVASP